MNCQQLIFSRHAVQQMFFRRISEADVRTVVALGEIIETYPDDQPLPAYLLLDFVRGRPIHVVLSYDQNMEIGYIVTAYVPDEQIWRDNFRRRRSDR